MFLNVDVISRLQQIKQYANKLNTSLQDSDNMQTSLVISKFKQSMMKSDPHTHTNQFILDCLRAKNQKLRNEFKTMQQQKGEMEYRLNQYKKNKKEIRQCKIDIYITRISISLNECKKIDYEQSTIQSDYKKIYINSTIGGKYKNYMIQIQKMQQIEIKNNYIYFPFNFQSIFHVIIKFKTQKQAQKWNACLKYAQIIAKCRKKKQKLFQQPKQIPQQLGTTPSFFSPSNTIQNIPAQISASQLFSNNSHRNPLSVSQVSHFNFNVSNKNGSPSQSQNSDKKTAYQKSSEKIVQKTERNHSNENRGSGIFNLKDLSKRLQLNRPPTLVRLRQYSNQTDKQGDSKSIKQKSVRKQSEDIFKPHINQLYHEKMLQKYRSQQQNSQQLKSDSRIEQLSSKNQINDKIIPNNEIKLIQNQKLAKIKLLQQKKKQLLNKNINNIKEFPTFALDNKNFIIGIQQMDDENKSKSSNRVSNKSIKLSQQSNFHDPGQNIRKEVDKRISEKSQEQSPKILKKDVKPISTLQVSGYLVKLHEVEKTIATPTKIISKEQQSQIINSNTSQSSGSEDSDGHSDPSSHENHTESEDNNARSQQLKKGIILLKCSENGFWTHQKIIYLSQNENQIYCRDIKDKKIKKIKIMNISNVQYKHFDKGIIKHISKIQQDKCLVIRAYDEDKNLKNYEFVGNLAQPLERFANNLKLFVDYYKQNY